MQNSIILYHFLTLQNGRNFVKIETCQISIFSNFLANWLHNIVNVCLTLQFKYQLKPLWTIAMNANHFLKIYECAALNSNFSSIGDAMSMCAAVVLISLWRCWVFNWDKLIKTTAAHIDIASLIEEKLEFTPPKVKPNFN